MILNLNEEVFLAKNILKSCGKFFSAGFVAAQQRLQNMSAQTTASGDDSLVVLLQQFPIDSRLVVITFEKRAARQLNEIAVANI